MILTNTDVILAVYQLRGFAKRNPSSKQSKLILLASYIIEKAVALDLGVEGTLQEPTEIIEHSKVLSKLEWLFVCLILGKHLTT